MPGSRGTVETADLAYDNDLEWFHCNRCKNDQHSGRTFFLASCGHTFCQNCLQQSAGAGVVISTDSPQFCSVCQNETSIVPLDDTLTPDLQQFFGNVQSQLEAALQVSRFQQSNAVKIIRYLKEKTAKQHKLLEKMAHDMDRSQELHERMTKLQQENNLLQQENQRLRAFIQGNQRAGESPGQDQMRGPVGNQSSRPQQPSRLSLPPGTPSSTTSGPGADSATWRRSPQHDDMLRPDRGYGSMQGSHSAMPAQSFPQQRYGGYASQTPKMGAAPGSASMRKGPTGVAPMPGSAMPSSIRSSHDRSWVNASDMRQNGGFSTPQLNNRGMASGAPGASGGMFASYSFDPSGPGPRQPPGGYSSASGAKRGVQGRSVGGGGGPGPIRNQQQFRHGSAMPGYRGR